MKKYIYILVFIFYNFTIQANTIDSLKNVVSLTNNDTLKVRALNKIAEYYININKDTAILLSNRALSISKERNIEITEIESYKELGIINIYRSEFTEAINFLNKALSKALETKEQEEVAQIHYLLGIIYYNIDKYDKAIQEYNKALFIAQQNDFKNIKLNCYNAIGVSNKAMGNYDHAIEYYFKSLKQAQEQNNQEAISNAYNNIGVIYKSQELYDDAIKFYKKACVLDSIRNNEYNLMQIYQNLGVVYKLKGDYITASKYYKKALNIAFKIDSKSGKSKAYSSIGILLMEEKKYDEAISKLQQAMQYALEMGDRSSQASNYITLGQIYLSLYDSIGKSSYLKNALNNLLEAYKISTEIKTKEDIKSSASLLKEVYHKLGNFKESLNYANIFIKINEELYNKNKLNVIESLKQRFETEKNKILIEKLQKAQSLRNQKIKTQKLKNTIKQRQIILLFSILIFLLIFFIYILFTLKKNKKLNRKIEEKSIEIKKQYLKSVKQNIEIKAKDIEKAKQQQVIIEKNQRLQELNEQLVASEEELKQQNEVLYQKNQKIQQQQEKIKEVIRQFEDTIENMEDVFFQTDKNFIQTKISPSIKKYLKLDSLDQIIGKPLTEFWNITSQELKGMTRMIIKEGFIKEMLFEYKTTDNKIGFGKVNARALYDKNHKIRGVEGIIRDITQDIESQRKIKELNTQKEVLINNIPSSIYYKDINLRYLAVNNNFAKKIGKPISEIIGKTDEELVLTETVLEYKELDEKVITTKKPILDYIKEYIDINNNPYWISISKIPYLDTNDNVAGVIGVVQDITEQIKHNREIRDSKDKIEKAHKHITDNINYAKGIQQALLPSSDIINSYFKDYFVFFKSKEQVSGDFYYFNKKNKDIIFTAADCTGHGVSGGFLTMLGITHINEIVSKNEINKPEEILNLLREKIKSTYRFFGTETQDGLDIALCTLNIETNILRYSGAYNPLWIIRNNELFEYKGTRNPIGFYINEVDFEGYEIQLQKNDMIYIFSDGFIDQFGGGINKKYTAKRFKQFLLSINKLPAEEQKNIMNNEFNHWKGDEEQTDDVLVIGIRI